MVKKKFVYEEFFFLHKTGDLTGLFELFLRKVVFRFLITNVQRRLHACFDFLFPIGTQKLNS